MEIERAKAVVQVADAITSTAKVEVEMMRVTGGTSATGFIPQQKLEGAPARPRLVDPTNPGAVAGKSK
jgi:ribosomal protein S6E (S10)